MVLSFSACSLLVIFGEGVGNFKLTYNYYPFPFSFSFSVVDKLLIFVLYPNPFFRPVVLFLLSLSMTSSQMFPLLCLRHSVCGNISSNMHRVWMLNAFEPCLRMSSVTGWTISVMASISFWLFAVRLSVGWSGEVAALFCFAMWRHTST